MDQRSTPLQTELFVIQFLAVSQPCALLDLSRRSCLPPNDRRRLFEADVASQATTLICVTPNGTCPVLRGFFLLNFQIVTRETSKPMNVSAKPFQQTDAARKPGLIL